MYLDNDNYKGKIGKVNISSKRKSIRIRFTHLSKRYEFIVATKTEEGFVKAVQVAQNIHRDIEMGKFDETLAKYSAKHKRALEVQTKSPSLLDLWNFYKLVSKERVAATTKKTHWYQYENNYLGDIFKKDPSPT